MDALTGAKRHAMQCSAGSQRNGIGVYVGFPKGKDLFWGEKGRNNNVRNPMILFGSKKGTEGQDLRFR
jgi:hypothetical protein